MSPSRRHLLLPSEKGLVHYDLLDEPAFLGPGPRGAILAAATPFPAAKLALSDDGKGYVVRALPGELPPEVDGGAGEGVRLADGARIRVGDQVALFRSPTAVPAAFVPPPSRAPRPRPDPVRTEATRGAHRAGTALVFGGMGLLLFAAWQAVRYLETKPAESVPPITAAMLAPPTLVRSTPEEQARVELHRLLAMDTGDVTTMEGVLDGYVSLARGARETAAGERAALRVTELRGRFAEVVWKTTSKDVESALRLSRYRTAIAALEGFEARFAGTDAAREIPQRIEDVRRDARTALDALGARVAPVAAKDATRAYRLLTTSNLELPADLAEELASWMARAREGFGRGATPPPKDPPPGPTPPAPAPAPGTPPGPTPPPTAPGPFGSRPKTKEIPDPTAPTPVPSADREAAARAVWLEAKEHLAARRFPQARDGYDRLRKELATTALVQAHPERVRAGYQAADVGVRGAVAFLRTEAEVKNGRLEAEWSFDDDRAFLEDFSVEQAFEGEEPAECEIRSGMAILSGSTAMLCKVVFDPSDVFVEADVVADAHRDYGLFALQHSKEWRSLALDVGNTQFKLKKGPGAKVLAGHIVWLFGDGVWKDADPGERGFVRIAERPGNGLKPSERFRIDLDIRGDRVEGAIRAKSDPTSLKGPLKGDDGKGIGPFRAGAFAYKGRVGVDRLKIVGKVDEGWALEEFRRLVAQETGP